MSPKTRRTYLEPVRPSWWLGDDSPRERTAVAIPPAPKRTPPSTARRPGAQIDSSGHVLSGLALPVGPPGAEIDNDREGHFIEIARPGCCARTIIENDKIRVLFGHGRDPSIGLKPIAVLDRLEETPAGLEYSATVLNTDYSRAIVPAIAAGLMGCSISFRMPRVDEQAYPPATSWNPEPCLPVRYLEDIDLIEISVVTWGAYPDATSHIEGAAA